MTPYPWAKYSQKLRARILDMQNVGSFSCGKEGLRLVIGEEGDYLRLYLLIDENDGIIADAKFQAYGESALLCAADIACTVLLRKNYEQARRLTAELIDIPIRDLPFEIAFPEEVSSHLNSVIAAIENAAEKCTDIPIQEIHTPVEHSAEHHDYPNWGALTNEEKLTLIKEVIAREIQPYIELDAGGIEVLELKELEIIIAYQGACTTCPSSIGATLGAIEQILRSQVYPELTVTPDPSFLSI